MAKRTAYVTHDEWQAIVEIVQKKSSVAALARAADVDASTVWRWAAHPDDASHRTPSKLVVQHSLLPCLEIVSSQLSKRDAKRLRGIIEVVRGRLA